VIRPYGGAGNWIGRYGNCGGENGGAKDKVRENAQQTKSEVVVRKREAANATASPIFC
jgi:hypothetical protein